MQFISTWFGSHLIEVYLVYGISFLALALATYIQPKNETALSFAPNLWLISLFALLHAGGEFILFGQELSGQKTVFWESAAMVLLVASGGFLFEFGRRVWINEFPASKKPIFGSWIYLPLLGIVASLVLLSEWPVLGLMAGARLALYLPGGLLTGVAMVHMARTHREHFASSSFSINFYGIGLGFIFYGLASGLVVSPDPGLPKFLPTNSGFFDAFGLPVQAIRAACAFIITGYLSNLLSAVNLKTHQELQSAWSQLRNLNDTLEQRIGERTSELEKLNAALEHELEQRLLAEKMLKAQHALFDAVANASPAMIWMSGPDKGCTYFNLPWLSFTGRSLEEELGDGWSQGVHHDDLNRCIGTYVTHFNRRLPFRMEYRLRRHDGEFRWVLDEGQPRYDEEGEFQGYIGSCLDITDRKKVEQALDESKSRLRAIFDAEPHCIKVLDREGKALDMNRAGLALIEADSPQQVVGQTLERFVLPEHRHAFARLFSKVLAGESGYLRFEVEGLKGTHRWMESHAVPLVDSQGKVTSVLAITRDITDRRKHEEALRTAEEKYRTLVEQIPAITYIATINEMPATRYISPQLEKQLGFGVAEWLADPGLWMRQLHEQDRGRVLVELKEAHECLKPFSSEYRLMTKQGKIRWFRDDACVIKDASGRPMFMQGVLFDITDSKQAVEALSKREADLKRAQSVAQMGGWHVDKGTQLLSWSEEALRLFGLPPGTSLDFSSFLARVLPEDRPLVENSWKSAMSGKPHDIHYRMADGENVRWFREQAEPELDGQGNLAGTVGTVQDVTERQRHEQALADSLRELKLAERRQRELANVAQREQGKMAALLSAMNIGILFEDSNQRIEYVNPAFMRLWGVDAQHSLEGLPTPEALRHSTHRFARPYHASKHLLHVLDTREISERFELELADGRILTQLSYPVTDKEGHLLGRMWIYEDITHERHTAQQLLRLAERDPLTGLYNRHSFQGQLEKMIAVSLRDGSRFGLLYFDLDEFKTINDTFGHRAGDSALIRTASEISTVVRATEMFARLGGDEFAILSSLHSVEDVSALAVRIVSAVAAIPFRFRGNNLRLTASLGVAVFPDHGDNGEELVSHADTAMYQAKSHGKNSWSLYDPALDAGEAMARRLAWSSRIAKALEEDAFELHFQGVYQADGNQLDHLEVLLRMVDPEVPNRLLMPAQFIPAAEKSRQVLAIDRWVISRCIERLGKSPKMPPLAINISGRSFDEPSLPQFIRTELRKHGVDPKRLIIEVNEFQAVSDLQDAQRFIEAVRQVGCRVCLDDFGSGFSTFAYIKYLGVDMLKVDGLFIHNLPRNRDNQVFVKAIIEVAKGLNKILIAESVEDHQTLEMLRKLGVDYVQGYLLDRPAAAHPAMEDSGLAYMESPE